MCGDGVEFTIGFFGSVSKRLEISVEVSEHYVCLPHSQRRCNVTPAALMTHYISQAAERERDEAARHAETVCVESVPPKHFIVMPCYCTVLVCSITGSH